MYSSIPLSPLVEEIETPLAGFYVMPDIVVVRQKSLTCHEEVRTPIQSLRDIFSTGNGDQQEIYLSADAGFGKTAFSKYLAITWCQAHCQDENYACFKDDELKTIFDFEFLFLILLRDFPTVCKIDDMIEQQITKNLPSTTKLPSSSILEEVLRREKCFIILDGLDEWTHPEKSCNAVTEQIPHRYVRDNCVILTTTRPWKLGVSSLKTSQMNKKVELVQLSADSIQQLEENAIKKMTGVHDERVLKSERQVLDTVICNHGLEHMQVIPLLLMYIVCLWCNKIPLGSTKHEIYTNIIEFLFSRTSKKHPEVQPSRESSGHEIPEYFRSHKFCKMFYSLIISLAELAYQTLFIETRENTLVFDRTVAEKYLKEDDMKLSLLSGILSESRSKTLMKELIKVSFSHKTVQEFFAAILISSQTDAQKTFLENCRSVEDILDMSKVWEFISKMNANRMCAISNDLMSVINEDEKTRAYRTMGYHYTTPLKNIQEMFLSCLQVMPESENIQLCLQDFFIIGIHGNSEELQRLFKQNQTNIKSLYIAYTTCIYSYLYVTDLCHLQKIYYEGDLTSEMAGYINRILYPSLQHVTLLNSSWRYDDDNLSDYLARCQNLQTLCICRITLSYNILETIVNFISGHKSMKELTLRHLHCEGHDRHDCERLNLDLSKHSTLAKLHLNVPVRLQLNVTTPSLVNVMLDGISEIHRRDEINLILFPSLQHVTLLDNKWLNDEDSLSENLPRCQNLQNLYIKNFTVSHKTLKTILNFISGQKSLKELTLDWLDCKEHSRHGCKKFKLDLSKHSTLTKFHFRLLPWRIELYITTPIHTNLQYLSIRNILLSHKRLETIFNFISDQKSMKELTLRDLNCKKHGRQDCKKWNLDLSQHSTLTQLELQLLPGMLQLNITTPSLVNVTVEKINLDESSSLLSLEMLNIKCVELRYMEMSAGSLQNFSTVLENLPQSVTVEMDSIQLHTKRLKENIQSSQTFHVIQDDYDDYDDDDNDEDDDDYDDFDDD